MAACHALRFCSCTGFNEFEQWDSILDTASYHVPCENKDSTHKRDELVYYTPVVLDGNTEHTFAGCCDPNCLILVHEFDLSNSFAGPGCSRVYACAFHTGAMKCECGSDHSMEPVLDSEDNELYCCFANCYVTKPYVYSLHSHKAKDRSFQRIPYANPSTDSE